MLVQRNDVQISSGLDDLDAFQRGFVKAQDDDLRLLAPAGSGKTYSLLWRCVELHRGRAGEVRFLVVTFTRAARDELRSRLRSPAFQPIAARTDVVTLNGWGNRILRRHFQAPRIHASEDDRIRLLRNGLQPAWSADEGLAAGMRDQPFKLPKLLADLLDKMKSLGFDHQAGSTAHANERLDELEALGLLEHLSEPAKKLQDYGVIENGRMETFMDTALPFYVRACEAQRSQAAFTLEDQKYVAWLKLRQQMADGPPPDADERYTHVLVDEFQDINPLDLALVRQIADLNGARLTIVGDDDQAIFEWRGATPDYILEPERFLGRRFETHILERNYRCPRNIVGMSARLIAHNRRRVAKTMTPALDSDAEIAFFRAESFLGAAQSVMEEVRAFLAANRPGAKIAILSRKRAQLIPYQIMMAREGVAFCAAEDLQVFMSDTFERLIRALQTRAMSALPVRSPTMVEDVLSLANSVNRFPLSKSDNDLLGRHLRAAKPKTYDAVLDALEDYKGPIKKANADGKIAAKFARAVRRFLHAPTVRAALEAIEALDGYQQDFARGQEDIFLSDPPFFYLTEFAETYGADFQSFIDDLETAKDTLVKLPGEDRDEEADALWKRPIHMMTALRAKGKEFDTVLMLDAVDGIWPLRSAKGDRGMEAERRLFYVAMTRAKRRLILTMPGRIGDAVAQPSPFLAEAGIIPAR